MNNKSYNVILTGYVIDPHIGGDIHYTTSIEACSEQDAVIKVTQKATFLKDVVRFSQVEISIEGEVVLSQSIRCVIG